MRSTIVVALVATLLGSITVACDKSHGGGDPAVTGSLDKKDFVGNWSGGRSSMNIASSGKIKSHIVDAKGATADVDGEVQAFNPTNIIVNVAGSTLTIPLKSPPTQVGGKWTMVVAGVESGDVTLVRN